MTSLITIWIDSMSDVVVMTQGMLTFTMIGCMVIGALGLSFVLRIRSLQLKDKSDKDKT